MERTDRDDGGVDRVDVVRHQCLQRHHDARRGDDGVGRAVRHGAVAALAVHGDRGRVHRRHRRAAAERDRAHRHTRRVVQGEDRIAREAREKALFDHALATARTFFGGLEDQVQRAVEAPALRQVARRREQRGGVAIMTTGVHGADAPAGPGEGGGLDDGQRVHVGADADGLAAVADFQLRDQARAGDAAVNAVAPPGEQPGNEVGGGVLLEREFRVLVDAPAHVDHLRQHIGERASVVFDFHARLVRLPRKVAPEGCMIHPMIHATIHYWLAPARTTCPLRRLRA